jgi:hypothetical protein
MRVWIFQDSKQVAKHGEAAASWYVGWYTPDGKSLRTSCGAGEFGKREAKRLRDKRRAELIEGTYDEKNKVTRADFGKQYQEEIVPALSDKTAKEARAALDRFEENGVPVGP